MNALKNGFACLGNVKGCGMGCEQFPEFGCSYIIAGVKLIMKN